ncbi:hypothetical protein DFP72DRAFT_1062414 [Ephemerocybe angulata]|uniref:Uncharacterized protein n=1 Tax=Ephemerocybe angulata TaxID=980116 RepID=A0A8H6MAR6_9AGAR|nr:hypothetical protein DFP72DRAFT_1062414 [Tulosesus angulatus]
MSSVVREASLDSGYRLGGGDGGKFVTEIFGTILSNQDNRIQVVNLKCMDGVGRVPKSAQSTLWPKVRLLRVKAFFLENQVGQAGRTTVKHDDNHKMRPIRVHADYSDVD